MTSTIELDRPAPAPRNRRRGRTLLIVLAAGAGALLTTVATAGAYVVTHAGNEPLAAGVHTVDVYTVDDPISTVVAPADRPGVLGRFWGMCDADSYYMEINGTGQCLVLNGSLGTVQATGTDHGAELTAAEAAKVRDIARAHSHDAPEPPTRVILSYDGGWAGLINLTDVAKPGPVTATVIG